MRNIHLHPRDAAELAELLTFLGDWLTGAQASVLAPSLASFVGHPGYDITTLHSDLHRFVFLLSQPATATTCSANSGPPHQGRVGGQVL